MRFNRIERLFFGKEGREGGESRKVGEIGCCYECEGEILFAKNQDLKWEDFCDKYEKPIQRFVKDKLGLLRYYFTNDGMLKVHLILHSSWYITQTSGRRCKHKKEIEPLNWYASKYRRVAVEQGGK